jgi:putative redox protein
MSTHSIHSSFSGGMAFKTSINGHDVLTDTTEDDGGSNSGPGPKRLMLTALSGCTGIDIVSILNKMKVSFSDFSIDIEATLSEEHPKIYEQVKLTYSIRLAESDQAKMEKAVKLSQEKYCGVYAMFSAFAKMETAIWFL